MPVTSAYTDNQHYADFLSEVTALVTQYRFEFKQPFSVGSVYPAPSAGYGPDQKFQYSDLKRRVRADLEQRLNQPVALANDADCLRYRKQLMVRAKAKQCLAPS